MTVIGIETATVTCSTAVAMNGHVLAEVTASRARAHAEMLPGQIDEVLTKADLVMGDVYGIAVSVGPGSFTGLRIGLSVAKGLAWSAGKQLVGVSTLKALARKALDAGEAREGDMLLTVIDSRKGEVYCRLDTMRVGTAVTEWDDRAVSVEGLLTELQGMSVVVTGETGQLKESSGGSGNLRFVGGDVARCSAGTVALEGETMLARGELLDIRTLEPRYITEFVPKMKSTERV